MTLKTRLTAMMVVLLLAVMALQYLLSEREHRELVDRLRSPRCVLARVDEDHHLVALADRMQRLLVRGFAGLAQSFLLVVKVVQATAVLRAAVVALAHPGGWIVALPEPS